MTRIWRHAICSPRSIIQRSASPRSCGHPGASLISLARSQPRARCSDNTPPRCSVKLWASHRRNWPTTARCSTDEQRSPSVRCRSSWQPRIDRVAGRTSDRFDVGRRPRGVAQPQPRGHDGSVALGSSHRTRRGRLVDPAAAPVPAGDHRQATRRPRPLDRRETRRRRWSRWRISARVSSLRCPDHRTRAPYRRDDSTHPTPVDRRGDLSPGAVLPDARRSYPSGAQAAWRPTDCRCRAIRGGDASCRDVGRRLVSLSVLAASLRILGCHRQHHRSRTWSRHRAVSRTPVQLVCLGLRERRR